MKSKPDPELASLFLAAVQRWAAEQKLSEQMEVGSSQSEVQIQKRR